MQCPKCHSDYRPEDVTCPSCGIVFAKYFRYHAAPSAPQQGIKPPIRLYDDGEGNARRGNFQQFMFDAAKPASWFSCIGRTLIFIGLALWSWRFISAPIAGNYVGQSFMHLINLPFHEAGHIIFKPFGAFITSLGGSLGQLLMPAICFGVLLLKTRDPFGASVALWWVGENFLDMAPYINDARAGELPLLGGNFGHSSPYGFHDWEYILNESGLLRYDHAFAQTSFFIGSLLMLAALTWAAMVLYTNYKTLRAAE
ncbi:MAG: TFIIB-type zinc ribbon-containing protein [Gammaproteobacteria bacterium]